MFTPQPVKFLSANEHNSLLLNLDDYIIKVMRLTGHCHLRSPHQLLVSAISHEQFMGFLPNLVPDLKVELQELIGCTGS